MKLPTPNQMKQIDDIAINEYKIPGMILMENAALHVVKAAKDMLRKYNFKKVAIIAGKGNNGGDAFAVARHLMEHYDVTVVSVAKPDEVSRDSSIFLNIVNSLNANITYCTGSDSLKDVINIVESSDLIIDGIFGTGIHGDITNFYADVIRAINESGKKIISVDIPSGINGETGQVCNVAVRADKTVTFSLPKVGLYQFPGREYAGDIVIADIGIPSIAIEKANTLGELLDDDFINPHIVRRPKDGHKGTFGRVLIITGSEGMTGAGVLSALSAFKAGSGLVYLAVPESFASIYSVTIPEAITLPLKDKGGAISDKATKFLINKAQTMDAVVIGPGLSTKPKIEKLVNDFVENCQTPLIIDADALNVLNHKVLQKRTNPAVITPHPGEFARLCNCDILDIQKDRVNKAIEYSKKMNVICVLKGAGTVIACPDGKYYINSTGHHSLAVAGAGDVLAGMIGSFLGQGLSTEMAACMGVFIHGKCGEMLAQKNNGQAGYRASELCSVIPSVVGELKRGDCL